MVHSNPFFLLSHLNLQKTNHTHTLVFVRRDSVEPPLDPTYAPPFSAISYNDKHFVSDRPGRTRIVSEDYSKVGFRKMDYVTRDFFYMCGR